jgi:hypothetical protein
MAARHHGRDPRKPSGVDGSERHAHIPLGCRLSRGACVPLAGTTHRS